MNVDELHAEIVLKKLGLEDCFQGVICFETINHHLEFAKDDHHQHSNPDEEVAAGGWW
jgi:FMN phosphatase YigB (HAD superfamily)